MSLRTFNVGGIYNGVQPGMITSYIGTTTTDPDTITADPPGWVIANGQTRNNGDDGRYNNLIELGIGSGIANAVNYTPINLKASMLRGINSQEYDTKSYAGPPALKGVLPQKMKNHKHTFQIQAHNHDLTVEIGTTSYDITGGGRPSTGSENAPKFGVLAINGVNSNDGYADKANYLDLNDVYDISIGKTSIKVNTVNNTVNAGKNIFPVNYGVHWIIKL
jgi:hypothetical protein